MSLLRNFSPGGSEPDDDEEPTTAAQQDEDERPAPAEPGETAPSGGGHAPGAARYAFAAPAASAAPPPPPAVVPSEVVTEPDDLAPGDPALDDLAPGDPALDHAAPGDPAPATAPVPVAETAGPSTTPPDREIPVAHDAPRPVFVPAAPQTPAPVTAPVPVPSPRATGEAAPTTPPAAAPDPNYAAPLLGDAAELRARWQRVQGDFVDDPLVAVGDAADLVGQTAEALVAALRERQRQLRATWQRSTADGSPAAADGQSPAAMAPGAPDTEQLRLMMQRYRALFNQLCRPS
jgi:hypothetical protein